MTASGFSKGRPGADRKSRLLRGASLVTLLSLMGAGSAAAQSVAALRAGAGLGVPAIVAAATAAPAANPSFSSGMSAAQTRALRDQARVVQGTDIITQAQAAARAAAAALLKANGSPVPDGLGAGGLLPVNFPPVDKGKSSGLQDAIEQFDKNTLPANHDPTGINTWQGATIDPSSTGTTVTIDQTDPRAVLSWNTFNVGPKTTLNFNQKLDGKAQPQWVVLNRVVGQIDPATGLRDPHSAADPSKILGTIKADGMVLVLNPNGVLFDSTAQINLHALVATSLDIGRPFQTIGSTPTPLTIQQRNEEFLTYGLLGFADQASPADKPGAYTFSAEGVGANVYDPTIEGQVEVHAGAQITTDDGGWVLLAAPRVINSGALTAPDGQVSLEAARVLTLNRSEGASNSFDPNVRGFVVTAPTISHDQGDYVRDQGLITVDRGYISVGAVSAGAVLEDGVLSSTTSVAANGFIRIDAGQVQLGPDATLSITPDAGGETIPQNTGSTSAFRPSKIQIGDVSSAIDLQHGAMIYAPSANVDIGDAPGPVVFADTVNPRSQIFIDSGAVIDVAGLTDVLVPATRNQIQISPVKKNELQDSPNYKNSFLNGATVFVDPRLSGVRSDGVAWVGSPLIAAASYNDQVGIGPKELMTTGGNVTLGVSSFTGATSPTKGPSVIVKSGAVINVSGGWRTFQAGEVQTTQLVNTAGEIVDIGSANPNDAYIGVYTGFVSQQARWGITQTFANPLLSGMRMEGQYTEGRDAGSLTVKASIAALDGTVYAQSYPGTNQRIDATPGSAGSSVYGDKRHLQAAPSQLPAGGLLYIQALGQDEASGVTRGGAPIAIDDSNDFTSLSQKLSYGEALEIAPDGSLVVPPRSQGPVLPADRIGAIHLSADALSGMGLGQLALQTSGGISVDSEAVVNLDAGGVFSAQAGRAINVYGQVYVPSGTINLQTVDYVQLSSVIHPSRRALGDFDINVEGVLSTRGKWVNDFGADPGDLQGSAYLNGGSITLSAAPHAGRLSGTQEIANPSDPKAASTNTDFSGSIVLAKGSLIDVSGGGYVTTKGSIVTTAKGGNLTLVSEDAYFQETLSPNLFIGGVSGFRVLGDIGAQGETVAINPSQLSARVDIHEGTILAHGFGGGGTFTLVTPRFGFGDGRAAVGTEISTDFFSKTGFATYDITSYGTALLPNRFENGLRGWNAVLATQVVTVKSGQTVSLSQSRFSPILGVDQMNRLRDLGTGGDLYSVLKPVIPKDAWDRLPVNLDLGGLLELHVEQGGAIIGEAGGSLTTSQLFNEGVIRIPGGTLRQSETLPVFYTTFDAIGVSDLSQVFRTRHDGSINENAPNAFGVKDPFGVLLTNAQVAAHSPIYLLADLAQGEGVRLAPGSVTDLSGVRIINPRAKGVGPDGETQIVDGRILQGGTLQSDSSFYTGANLFAASAGGTHNGSGYFDETTIASTLGLALNAQPGAHIDLQGAKATFDKPATGGGFAATPEWSDGGALTLGGGGTIVGAIIRAQGGADQALGGTLTVLDPVLAEVGSSNPPPNLITASMIDRAGFSTFVAEGSITSSGNVTLALQRGFFLTSTPYDGISDLSAASVRQSFTPVFSSGGFLSISAPYISLDSDFQTLATPDQGKAASNRVILSGDIIDVTGAVLFDKSVARVDLWAKDALRLTGVQPWQTVFDQNPGSAPNSLVGQLAVARTLNIRAGEIYPTTGASFEVTSSGTHGTINIGVGAAGASKDIPYSAGGSLLIQAHEIVQSGVVRAPLGTLQIGSNTALSQGGVQFAPATGRLELASGSTTSVSAGGLSIPYGTTTDQTEWFFAPTSSDQLTAPPAGVLHLAGAKVALDKGATVDISGGGDVYAYEFIPGTGGSRDVLDQFNPDAFTGNGGYQYPDHRQVYAIVPGLSDAGAAAIDPIYSTGYGSLYGAQGAGERVYLSAAPGLAAGWYTLLPAKYALLPGGMRVVEDTGAATPAPGSSHVLADGTLVVAGQYGVAGADTKESAVKVFDVQSQSVIRSYSNIALTSADQKFAALAARNQVAAPPLPIDASRLILDPITGLSLYASFSTAPASGGRGADIDVTGQKLQIWSSAPASDPGPGVIALTSDSLTGLHAASLLIGGVRTDNADGTTNIDVTASSILVGNDADHPLTAGEIVMAVDGGGSTLRLGDGATITASGSTGSTASGDYILNGSTAGMTARGSVLRVSSGPERLITRVNQKGAQPFPGLGVGTADLKGTSVLLDSTGYVHIDPDLKLKASNVALGAFRIGFAPTIPASGLTLTITPQLQAVLSKARHLTLKSTNAIAFASGDYAFANLKLNTPGLQDADGGTLNITAKTLDLANDFAAAAPCTLAGPLACGTGSLTVSADQIVFDGGALATYGVGGKVDLAATRGIFTQGTAALDLGPAELDIEAPFVGDRALPADVLPATQGPSLSLTTGGLVAISDPGGASAGSVEAAPGAGLSISGHSISIDRTELRATAGTLTLRSATDVTVADGARLETPGYVKTFGDAADPVQVSAPGGDLRITALAGNISLASGTKLSIGGGKGAAGALSLTAAAGNILMDGSIDANAPEGAASLSYNSKGAFDWTGSTMDALSRFVRSMGADFTGAWDVRTATGDLVLKAGDSVRATSFRLTADGGLTDVAGHINVSGVNGGQVDLFGLEGVTLETGSKIDAHANGYGASDTRRASAGDVLLGTDGSGAITVKSGAFIDLSVRQGSDRLVPIQRDGATFYSYVQADQGGTLTLRAPIVQLDPSPTAADTVHVTYAGRTQGAREVVLEAFRRFDLSVIAADPAFTGVHINPQGQAILNLNTSETGKLNFLSDLTPKHGPLGPLTDKANETLVDFIQDFDVSGAYGHLGGLASQANFHARPGVELDYSGDIVLNSNWNLGAGTVDVAGAVTAGLMEPSALLTGQYDVIPGKEAQLFSQFVNLTYRTGGMVTGEPGVLTLRAGGTLDLEGSITDGFFQFRDQTDPGYLNYAMGGGDRTYTATMAPNCLIAGCTDVVAWDPTIFPADVVSIIFPGGGDYRSGAASALFTGPPAPYSALANSPGALGSLANGSGDPLGSAELFPRLPAAGGGTRAVESWSYRLVGGAAMDGAGPGAPSVDPLRVDPTSSGGVTLAGSNPYFYSPTKGVDQIGDTLLLGAGTTFVTADQWLASFQAANPGLATDAYTTIDLTTAPGKVAHTVGAQAVLFFASYPGEYTFDDPHHPTLITTRLDLAAAFMTDVASFYGVLSPFYKAPLAHVGGGTITATAPSLVRTGSGSIDVAAAADIDLRNGADTTYLNIGGKPASIKQGGLQVGGTSIYTAGYLADLSARTVGASHAGMKLDPAAFVSSADIFANPPDYRYGEGASIIGGSRLNPSNGAGVPGILLANPVYLDGGGDVTLQAGGSVLGRRNIWQETRIADVFQASAGIGYPWIGPDQAWRIGVIGGTPNVEINPQLFSEGVGALGGGDIRITAGGDVSDLSIVSDTSLATGAVTSSSPGAPASLALMTFGGGGVSVLTGGDLVAGRLDVASGQARLNVGGGVLALAPYLAPTAFGGNPVPLPDALRIRLSDATVDIAAQGSIELQGVAALGAQTGGEQDAPVLNAEAFYSPSAGVSLIANGPVTIDNLGPDVVTPNDRATLFTTTAVYPGSLTAISLTGSVVLTTTATADPSILSGPLAQYQAQEVVLSPSATGELKLLAGGDVAGGVISMDDGDPTLLPGLFTTFATDPTFGVVSGRPLLFPSILPNTPDVIRKTYHSQVPLHLGDATPNLIYAGGDISGMILSTPKQTRIEAGRDIVNMMFFGQNLAAGDITRIVAGRDITATTVLTSPIVGPDLNELGDQKAALQGDTFVIGGPGSFFLEAGRDAGPFLNSAVTNGFANPGGGALPAATGQLTYGGGILSVGNEWNPWLPDSGGASIFTLFGVGKGADFDALRDIYLDPANLGNLDGALFQQVTDSTGASVPDRTKPIYAPILIGWMQANEASVLTTAYGTTNVSFQQAYDAFKALPELTQRVFLISKLYFNELEQTSIPTSPSYLKYSRGYQAVNALFPASLGYTQNDLSGGSNGANQTVETGNLDLRLATIQTERGGDIFILGPGGNVLAGSTVRTSDQAARRTYDGGRLFSGDQTVAPYAATITSIPTGFEGILTLRGGSISTFTDGSFLLNQSRLFTEQGGDVVMWSSNADLNAGQGPKTSANFPPIVLHVDEDAFSIVDRTGSVSGAGIAAFQPSPDIPAPDVFLIAPRGTVDAGDAGVRVAGNLYIAALTVANADNFKVSGNSFGVPAAAAVDVGAQTSAGASAAAAQQAAQAVAGSQAAQVERSVITVDVLGYVGEDEQSEDDKKKRK
jgi:filamentous hemagglutinin family protein